MRSDPKRRENAAMLLSTTGAAVSGAGVALLLGTALGRFGPIILGVGLIAHIVGMIARRRLQQAEGYVPAPWENATYWLCWALIVLLIGYISMELI